jgi:hypothetical protein
MHLDFGYDEPPCLVYLTITTLMVHILGLPISPLCTLSIQPSNYDAS